MPEGEEPNLRETNDDGCPPRPPGEVRTSITTTTMKKGDYKDKERSEESAPETPDITVEEIVDEVDE